MSGNNEIKVRKAPSTVNTGAIVARFFESQIRKSYYTSVTSTQLTASVLPDSLAKKQFVSKALEKHQKRQKET